MGQGKLLWWQSGIIYQIYPRSFQDSNGDGIGDIRGIISRLDYLKWLGVSAIWVSPIYRSPMADFGYDITDHKSIDPLFGTKDDFDELLKEIHARGMKLLMDFVPNHTSIEHEWFKESRSSRNNPKRDWYIWRDAKPDGSEPNNWLSAFKEKGWEWDEKTQQYFFHSFRKDQPDLNWRNPEVQKAQFDIMRFWLDKGIDGFRVDMLHHLIKDEFLRDNPANVEAEPDKGSYNKLMPVYSADQFLVHKITKMMRELCDEYKECLLLGEIYVPVEKILVYYGLKDEGVHLPFNFLLVSQKWEPASIAGSVAQYDAGLPEYAWPNWVMGNHDQPRIAARVGVEQTKNAAILLLTLRGTVILNGGDELGVKGPAIPLEELMDPLALEVPELNQGRDPMRSPMLWDDSLNAGFTKGKPWLRIDKHYKALNVEKQKKEEDSLLVFYKKLIAFRQQEPSLLYGHYYPVYADSQIYAYKRKEKGHDAFLIVLNFSHRPCYFKPPSDMYEGEIVICTSPDLLGKTFKNDFAVEADEGFVVRLNER